MKILCQKDIHIDITFTLLDKKKTKEDVIYCHVRCVTLMHFRYLVILWALKGTSGKPSWRSSYIFITWCQKSAYIK